MMDTGLFPENEKYLVAYMLSASGSAADVPDAGKPMPGDQESGYEDIRN
jgi:hypothetical protein